MQSHLMKHQKSKRSKILTSSQTLKFVSWFLFENPNRFLSSHLPKVLLAIAVHLIVFNQAFALLTFEESHAIFGRKSSKEQSRSLLF
jgi:hypothetical protein